MTPQHDHLLSADSHFHEPLDLWDKRLPKKFLPKAPRVVWTDKGHVWTCAGRQSNPVGPAAWAGRSPDKLKVAMRYDEIRPGAWDPAERLKDMDQDGVWCEVIYPTSAIEIFPLDDLEFHMACVRAYNDFVAEFNSHRPDRLLGLGMVPMSSVQDAIGELERIRIIGLKGAVLQAFPSRAPIPTADDEVFWAAAQEIGLPLSVHIVLDGQRRGPQGWEGLRLACSAQAPRAINGANVAHNCQDAFSSLIFTGVLERYPNLTWVCAEAGIGWIPYFLERCDDQFMRRRYINELPMSTKPSECWSRQVYATFQVDTAGVRLAMVAPELQSPDRVMWASDYPHGDSTWPNSRKVVDRHFEALPNSLRGKLTRDNVVRLYGIP